MKKKALIIGALPVPFEGPWVVIDDADGWDVRMEHEYGKMVKVEFNGSQTRAVILEPIPDVPHVSIWLEAKNERPQNRYPTRGT